MIELMNSCELRLSDNMLYFYCLWVFWVKNNMLWELR